MGIGEDPHYSILLPTGQLLCFSVRGGKNLSYNLISNQLIVMNALFIPDSKREEITWIGSLGIVVKGMSYRQSNVTKLKFEALGKKVFVGNKVTLMAQRVGKLTFGGWRLLVAESGGQENLLKKRHEVQVDLLDVGLSFSVRFVKNHLDLTWKKVEKQPRDSHGLIGMVVLC